MALNVDDLPNEILEYTFQFLLSVSDQCGVLSVCKRWREISVSSRALWRSGNIRAPLWISLSLARFLVNANPNGLALSVVVPIDDTETLGDELSRVAGACEAVRFCTSVEYINHVSNINPEWREPVITFLRATNASLLQRLDLTTVFAALAAAVMPTTFAGVVYYEWGAWKISGRELVRTNTMADMGELARVCKHMPRLEILAHHHNMSDEIYGSAYACQYDSHIDWSLVRFPALRELRMTGAYRGRNDWVAFVRACPALEAVNLRDFDVSNVWPDACARPPLRELHMLFKRKSFGRGPDTHPFVDVALPTLEELSVDVVSIQVGPLLTRIATLPRLRLLRLCSSHNLYARGTEELLRDYHSLIGAQAETIAAERPELTRIEVDAHSMNVRGDVLTVAWDLHTVFRSRAEHESIMPDLSVVAERETQALRRERVTESGSWRVRVSVALSLHKTFAEHVEITLRIVRTRL